MLQHLAYNWRPAAINSFRKQFGDQSCCRMTFAWAPKRGIFQTISRLSSISLIYLTDSSTITHCSSYWNFIACGFFWSQQFLDFLKIEVKLTILKWTAQRHLVQLQSQNILSPQKKTMYPLKSHWPPRSQSLATTIWVLSLWIYLSWIFCINGII